MSKSDRGTCRRLLRIPALCFVLIGALGLLPAAASAQNQPADLERRVESLEKEVTMLKGMLLDLSKPPDEPASARPSAHKVPGQENWEGLRIGMSEDSVLSLLGKPSRLQTLSSLTYWYYEGGTGYIRPHVAVGNDNHLVYGWMSP